MFLGLFVPQGFDSEQDAKDFVEELGLTYAFATDKMAKITRDYRLTYFPTTIFIDADGNIFKTWGGALNTEVLRKQTNAMLSQ